MKRMIFIMVMMVAILVVVKAQNAKCSENCEIKTNGEMVVIVNGVEELEGSVLLCVGEMNSHNSYTDMKSADDYEIIFSFKSVAYGEYPVQAFQDMNSNFTLDMDEYGRPLEPCVATKAELDEKNNVVTIELKKY